MKHLWKRTPLWLVSLTIGIAAGAAGYAIGQALTAPTLTFQVETGTTTTAAETEVTQPQGQQEGQTGGVSYTMTWWGNGTISDGHFLVAEEPRQGNPLTAIPVDNTGKPLIATIPLDFQGLFQLSLTTANRPSAALTVTIVDSQDLMKLSNKGWQSNGRSGHAKTFAANLWVLNGGLWQVDVLDIGTLTAKSGASITVSATTA